jgi:hypothetical protein
MVAAASRWLGELAFTLEDASVRRTVAPVRTGGLPEAKWTALARLLAACVMMRRSPRREPVMEASVGHRSGPCKARSIDTRRARSKRACIAFA